MGRARGVVEVHVKRAFSANLPRKPASYRSPVSMLASPKGPVEEETVTDQHALLNETACDPSNCGPSGLRLGVNGHGEWLDVIEEIEAQVRLRQAIQPMQHEVDLLWAQRPHTRA